LRAEPRRGPRQGFERNLAAWKSATEARLATGAGWKAKENMGFLRSKVIGSVFVKTGLFLVDKVAIQSLNRVL